MTASDPESRPRPSTPAMVVWVLFCFMMWAWAIVGPITVLTVAFQMIYEPEWGAPLGVTERDKWMQLQIGAVLGAVGIAFAYLRLWGYLRFGDRD
jgi:hypothetical protein